LCINLHPDCISGYVPIDYQNLAIHRSTDIVKNKMPANSLVEQGTEKQGEG
jgi:hypothetical protein